MLGDIPVETKSGWTWRGEAALAGRDFRLLYRMPGQGVGVEEFRGSEEGDALSLAMPHLQVLAWGGAGFLRAFLLPYGLATPQEVA